MSQNDCIQSQSKCHAQCTMNASVFHHYKCCCKVYAYMYVCTFVCKDSDQSTVMIDPSMLGFLNLSP